MNRHYVVEIRSDLDSLGWVSQLANEYLPAGEGWERDPWTGWKDLGMCNGQAEFGALQITMYHPAREAIDPRPCDIIVDITCAPRAWCIEVQVDVWVDEDLGNARDEEDVRVAVGGMVERLRLLVGVPEPEPEEEA